MLETGRRGVSLSSGASAHRSFVDRVLQEGDEVTGLDDYYGLTIVKLAKAGFDDLPPAVAVKTAT